MKSQQIDFAERFPFEDSEIYSLYETSQSPTAQFIDGNWRMAGKPTILVNEHLATHCRGWETGFNYIYPINHDHSNMVKFASSYDQNYREVKQRLLKIARKAKQAISFE